MGAGPLGLAVAAHLRDGGIRPFICGDPMSFWREQMPRGMLLRSPLRASNIGSPRGELALQRWADAERRELSSPLPLEDFVAYGQWFQRAAAEDLDRRRAASIESTGTGFRLVLEDGDELTATRVVVAAGIAPFAFIPGELRDLPRELVSHSSHHDDFAAFAGRHVAVVGAGQSALESSALLHEAGATVELIFRSQQIVWLDPMPAWRLPKMGAPTAVGGPRASWLAAAPDIFRRLPRASQPGLAYRCIRPAASAWLHTRTDEVAFTSAQRIVSAQERDGQLQIALSDSSERRVDHLMLATGFDVDIRRYPFLPAELTRQLALAGGYPVLRRGLESSLDGLFFAGAPAAHTFGPVMRFVTGSCYSAPAIARRVLGRRQPPISWAF